MANKIIKIWWCQIITSQNTPKFIIFDAHKLDIHKQNVYALHIYNICMYMVRTYILPSLGVIIFNDDLHITPGMFKAEVMQQVYVLLFERLFIVLMRTDYNMRPRFILRWIKSSKLLGTALVILSILLIKKGPLDMQLSGGLPLVPIKAISHGVHHFYATPSNSFSVDSM